ncbi:hypothetical protein AN639_00965 [Candidatus Epulonipiscium fishelsonii]|uniref:Uncharacterized protein n=1 Tax=Candidatus Epulonipiscium fishelsonii TaxID=77094 RepID=A0ACC8XBZ7_9FIRM|nr:hypothetical protein AN396_06140 [Epulopiscium sp. SCG-B11WGA-EpuloA1]ONI41364.1 hypothetical protein AN639_00965 [Epulopiscium sp. SCG-B05WGA-EpuloA1]
MTTLKDVAKSLNISAMTVSRAINDPKRVNKDLLVKIYEEMERLNYRPNQAARALVNQKTGIIQVVIYNKLSGTDIYFVYLISSIIDYLSKNNYSAIIKHGYDKFYNCDGMIVIGLSQGDDIEMFKKIDIPTVLFGKTEQNVDYVDINNHQGTYLATNYLIQNKYKNIAFIAIDEDEPFCQERIDGYIKALKDNKIVIKKEMIFCTNNTIEAGQNVFNDMWKYKPDAVVCSTDLIGLGIIEGAKRNNIRIPQELAIIGFDGVYLNQVSIPRLTTIRQPIYELGEKLASTLISRIKNPDLEQQTSILDLTLQKEDTVLEIDTKEGNLL